MCKPIRYVYPDCGHPVVPKREVWILERCTRAFACNRDCWIPNDILASRIQDKPWPNNNLTEPCALCEEERADQARCNAQIQEELLAARMKDSVMRRIQRTAREITALAQEIMMDQQEEQVEFVMEEDVEEEGSLGSAPMDLETGSSDEEYS
ncbi:PPIC-type PPIASE domain-containing [Fusarium albosuccineum]|uniref:PPIC-type PPIASE domain-containing n=1 Tax=Fusarium albosuccineum TaxID=1237068 RepID=A0A8H4L0H7_9HYPO|nr:PPIC-type PPIASE domain-containing [Fusarium albosuccineum]